MLLTAVVAVSENNVIGRAGGLPWHLPADLAHFKAVTMGHPMLMGRRTFDSIGKALPGRRNLVLTRGMHAPFDGQRVVQSVDEAIALAGDDDLAVIGGGEVYALALPRATVMNLTWVDADVAGADAFFPRFDPHEWIETARADHAADARHAFAMRFVDYRRAPPL